MRWESSDGVGYSDLLSWDLFQDPPLNVLMDWLRQGSTHPLLAQTKALAIEDLSARVCGVSLFVGLEVPASHWLCRTFSPAELEAAADEGFVCFKLKVSDDISALAAWFAAVPRGSRVRLDLGSSSPAVAKAAIEIAERFEGAIDFIEDPRLPTRLVRAADRQESEAAAVQVWKPAREAKDSFVTRAQRSPRWLVTTYLGHPLGNGAAAYEAAVLNREYPGRLGLGGLLSHRFYAADSFSHRLAPTGPRWQSPGGTGFGFDDLLEKLNWKAL